MLYIPKKDANIIGGPSTFLKNLQLFLKKEGFRYTNSPYHFSEVFFPIKFDLSELSRYRQNGVRVFQRLDGIYYYSKHGIEAFQKNQPIQTIYNSIADYVIFQSEYSKKQVFELFGEIEETKYSIIYNGADTRIFFPAKGRINETIQFVTTGNFRNDDMLLPIINALDDYYLINPNFTLHIIGPISIKDRDLILSKDYVRNTITKSQRDMADHLRKSDIFIYSHLNPPCPNSVIEAVCSGLPVVGFDSGAMNEILEFNKDLLAYVSDETFQKIEDFDSSLLLNKIEECVSNFEEYKKRALLNADEFSLEHMGQEYKNVFSKHQSGISKRVSNFFIENIVIAIKRRIIVKRSQFKSKIFHLLKIEKVIRFLIMKYISSLSEKGEITYLLELDNFLYQRQGKAAIRYGKGLHTKHKHTAYHDFFINNIKQNEKVIDIGCGNGALAYSIVMSTDCKSLTAIDMVEKKIIIARDEYKHEKLDFIVGDATTDLKDEKFDVVVLSNVLEHIEDRQSLLQKIKKQISPDRILIRVPMFDRDWRVPLKKELGVPWQLDKTHEIEYTADSFCNEITSTGLQIQDMKINWGEIWAIVR